jgi:mannosyl-3-phosphoglycerate phosphatase
MSWLIMTDLDGTLLDDGYPCEAAVRALDALVRNHPAVRVALASSKTAEEMVSLGTRCSEPPLLVFENGAGVARHDAARRSPGLLRRGPYEIDWKGPDYRHIRRVLTSLREERAYRFQGFGDMSDASVASQTGLDRRAARAARRRLASEPIVWSDDEARLADFQQDLRRRGLSLQAGGRFHHVTANACKARALRDLLRTVPDRGTARARTIACGDAPNDLAMLEKADFAVVFPSAAGTFLMPQGPSVFHAAAPGPDAWLSTIERVLNHQS